MKIKEYRMDSPKLWKYEQERLIMLMEKFHEADREALAAFRHPIFGKFTANEWDALMVRHVEHHFKQFKLIE
jgi:hypothetical protein